MNVGEHVAAATADYDLDHPQAKAAVQNQTPQTRARLIDGAASAEDWKALAQTHELRAEELSLRQRADIVAEARLANAAWSRWEAGVADVTGETVAPDIDRILREVHTKRETDPIQAAGPPLEYRYEDFRRDLHAGVTAPHPYPSSEQKGACLSSIQTLCDHECARRTEPGIGRPA